MQQLTFVGPQELEWREAEAPLLESDAAAIVRPLAVRIRHPVDAGDGLHQRRFAGAIVADEADDRAGIHLEVDSVQHLDGAETLGHARDVEEAHSFFSCADWN